MPLAVTHAIGSGADAFVAVSLASSLFFNLSPAASRQQVLLYLLVTAAPLAVLAPFVGPLVDRFRGFQRALGSTVLAARAGLCIALASNLHSLAFFGLALGLLVAAKASGVVKQALVPLLVDDPDRLVASNAQLALLSSAAGALGGGAAVALSPAIGSGWLLWIAGGLFATAAVLATRVRARSTLEPDRADTHPELYAPTLVVSSTGMIAIRAAVGFFMFVLAFALRTESEPAWVYGAAVVAYGFGCVWGNISAAPLHRRFSDSRLIAVAIACPAVPAVFGILGVSRPLLLTIAAFIGFSTTLGRQGFDSQLQRYAPAPVRGRVASRYETGFQLAWVAGAVLATTTSLPPQATMAVLAAFYLPALATFLRAERSAEALEHSADEPLAQAGSLLGAARSARDRGHSRLAVVEAAAAADLALIGIGIGEDDVGGAYRRSVAADVATLHALRSRAITEDSVEEADAESACALADSVVSRHPLAPTTRPAPP